MRTVDIIKKKRDGFSLTKEEIEFVIKGVTEGTIPDYQISALLMAIYFRGMNREEVHWWTYYMLHSGEQVDLSHIKEPKIDKHSTGGVGDKVSLALAPLVASSGIKVPMISGRGLGHTGGTLDKLESIPGFKVDIPIPQFVRIIERVGVCMIGQTKELTPADRKLYALRDVTATVDSIPLIAGSIMSKKLASGIEGLVLDVKVGKGAFMKTIEEAERLASTLVEIGKSSGKKVIALLTDMNQPLGCMIGNALEAKEAIDLLWDRAPQDLTTVTLELSARMLLLGNKAQNIEEAKTILKELIRTGKAREKMKEMISAQGGEPKVVEDYSLLPKASNIYQLQSWEEGYIAEIDAELVGISAMLLGAGRAKVDDIIDPAVGIELKYKVGDKVRKGDIIAKIHYNNKEKLEESLKFLKRAYKFSEEEVPPCKLIIKEIK